MYDTIRSVADARGFAERCALGRRWAVCDGPSVFGVRFRLCGHSAAALRLLLQCVAVTVGVVPGVELRLEVLTDGAGRVDDEQMRAVQLGDDEVRRLLLTTAAATAHSGGQRARKAQRSAADVPRTSAGDERNAPCPATPGTPSARGR